MPSSYQPPIRKDKMSKKTLSQTPSSNSATEVATVARILEGKRDVFAIRPQATLHDAVTLLRDKGIGALLVRDAEGDLVGILSERDIVRKLAETPGETLPKLVSDVMTKKVQVCAPGDPLMTVLRRMTEGKFRHMPVADDSGLVGMVTIGDVVNFRLNELEHETLQLKQLMVG